VSAEVTFTTAYQSDRDLLYIAASLDGLEDFAPFTRLFVYDKHNHDGRSLGVWTCHDVEWYCVVVTTWWKDKTFASFCAMSEEGHIDFMNEHGFTNEKIPGAGVFSEDAEGWGYLSGLKQIGGRGGHLYACGYNGQVYKCEGPNQWVHMDEGLLQAPDTKENELDLSDIGGPNESEIYTVGHVLEGKHSPKGPPAAAFFWNGQHWRKLELPEDSRSLGCILVESEQRVWLCGDGGTLLLGNAQEGFQRVSSPEDKQHFFSMTLFNGELWLASDQGLFIHDPANPGAGIRNVKTNLKPSLRNTHIVDSWDGVLWSIGRKDIARFNGKTWERIDHPDNPPIR
jgi:hypothetical protein